MRVDGKPLVSVIMITYNSELFVRETLESIKAQGYQNIELVVADDASSDGTLAVCRSWADENRSRFPSLVIAESPRNGGVVHNCNKGVTASSGEWIKVIAGDDLLLENCIEDYVDYVNSHPAAAAVFGHTHLIGQDSAWVGDFPNRDFLFRCDAREQLAQMVYANLVPACAAFINKEILVREGGFDPAYPMMEDYPLWVRLLSKEHRLESVDGFTVSYRIHTGAISSNVHNLSMRYMRTLRDFTKSVRLPLSKALPSRVRRKVRRDLFMLELRMRWPWGFRALVPIFWWGWNVMKGRKPGPWYGGN